MEKISIMYMEYSSNTKIQQEIRTLKCPTREERTGFVGEYVGSKYVNHNAGIDVRSRNILGTHSHPKD